MVLAANFLTTMLNTLVVANNLMTFVKYSEFYYIDEYHFNEVVHVVKTTMYYITIVSQKLLRYFITISVNKHSIKCGLEEHVVSRLL